MGLLSAEGTWPGGGYKDSETTAVVLALKIIFFYKLCNAAALFCIIFMLGNFKELRSDWQLCSLHCGSEKGTTNLSGINSDHNLDLANFYFISSIRINSGAMCNILRSVTPCQPSSTDSESTFIPQRPFIR